MLITMAEEVERIYIIPLRKYGFKSSKAAPTAVKRVRSYLTRHMKVEEDKIWIDDSLNTALWSQGKYHIPHRIRVKAVKFDDGVVEAYSPELEIKKSRRELLKEEREKKEPILKKEGAEAEEAEGEAKEEYEIAPTAEGEVKIKKKKAHKKKKPKEKPKEPEEAEEKPKETKKKPVGKKKQEPKEKKRKPKHKKVASKSKSSKDKSESK